jgi:hypothetical protein
MTRPDIEAVARAICAAHHEWHQSKSESDKDEYTARVVIQTLLSLGWQAPEAVEQMRERCAKVEAVVNAARKMRHYEFKAAVANQNDKACEAVMYTYEASVAQRELDEALRALPTTEVKPTEGEGK